MSGKVKLKARSSSRAWRTLPLSEWIFWAVDSLGFERMTPVQASTIPLFLGNKDVVVEAVTGSGKTFAFLIPIVEKLLRLQEPPKEHHVSAIVVSPTRELATQTHSVLLSLLGFHGPSEAALNSSNQEDPSESDEDEEKAPPAYPPSALKVVPQLVVGGSTSAGQDLGYFLKNSPNLLVATPGRLLELLASPKVRLPQSSFEVLVLDEADRLLDLGFKDDLQKILSRLPKQRRSGLFSASVSEAVDEIVRVGLRNPVKIAVKVKGQAGGEEQRTPTSLEMNYLTLPPSHKFPALVQLFHTLSPPPLRTIIYLSTCAAVDYFQHVLPALLNHPDLTSSVEPIDLVPLHGKHPPNVREKNFARFSNCVSPAALLTTDLAARGLDIPEVDLVIQIDPPSDPKVFLHRCGRAGRAGRAGRSVVLLSPGAEEDYVQFLVVRKTPVTPLTQPAIFVSDDAASAATTTIRTTVGGDRALHDKAQRAFVSWVRAYSKHQARAIFRIPELDWPELARAWGLLRLPRMPERKRWEGDESLGLDVDWDNYAYVDPQREAQRQQNAADLPESRRKAAPGKDDGKAWSRKEEQRAEKERRREKRGVAREAKRRARMTEEERAQEERVEELVRAAKRQRMLEQEEFNGLSD